MPAQERLRRWSRAHPIVLDSVLTAVLLVLGPLSMSAEVSSSRDAASPGEPLNPVGVVSVAFFLLYTLPVAVRRRSPLLSYTVVVGSLCTAYALHYSIGVGSLSALVVLYTIGAVRERLEAAVLLVVALLLYFVANALDDRGDGFWAVVFSAGIYVAAWAVGRSIRYRRAYTAELESRAERLEQTREAELRATLAEERARIARELHDVVAHSLSVMIVQASAAQRIAARDLPRSLEAMAAVESTGRASLVEMRRLVGVLREEGEGHPGLSPSPGIADLPELVGKVREAGLPVDMALHGPAGQLPTGVDLAVYRIVQEALTNTLKHAGPTSACVRVDRSQDAVSVAIEDSGRGAAALPSSGRSGHGLVGMQERVALYGGSLRVGPRVGGGYAVHARIPLDTVPS